MPMRAVQDTFSTLNAWEDLGTGMQLAEPGLVATPGAHDGWLRWKVPVAGLVLAQSVTIRKPTGSSSIGLEFYGGEFGKRVDCRFYELGGYLVAGTIEEGQVFRPLDGGDGRFVKLEDGDVFGASVSANAEVGGVGCMLVIDGPNGFKGSWIGTIFVDGVDFGETRFRIRSHRGDEFGLWKAQFEE